MTGRCCAQRREKKLAADHIDVALRRRMDKKKVVNERIVLTPVLDVFSPIYKMKNTTEDNLQEEVIEELNGAVVLNGSVAAIPIAEFSVFLSRHTAFLLGVHGQLEHPWTSS